MSVDALIIKTNFYKIIPYSNLLQISTFQSWDEAIVRNHIEDVKKIVNLFYDKKPWGLLSDRSEWQLDTPEAELLFSNTAISALNQTLTHIAIVIGDSELIRDDIVSCA